jgi:hypothetical protein
MPSGFQQDTNQLAPAFYRVVLDTSGYPTAAGNDNGGVTPNSSDSFGTLPTTLAKGQARARGNMRFRNIVNRLTGLADCHVLDAEITEANGDAQATALAFTVRFERDAFIQTGGTAVDGSTAITTKILKIKDEVTRGILDATTATVRVYNGTAGSDSQASITVAAPDTAGNVWADVTVSLIDGTELVSTI